MNVCKQDRSGNSILTEYEAERARIEMVPVNVLNSLLKSLYF